MQSGNTPQMQDPFADLAIPSTEEMKLQLQQLVEQGVMTPEEAQAELMGRSEMDNIQTDPRFREAQMDALLGLQEISDGGGMTMRDKSNLQKITNDEQTRARGAREAILQNAQSRGLGGSGMELMSQMINQQESASRTAGRDLDVAAMAQERALEALMKGGELGGQMQAQDFNQKAQVASANDAIAKFNAQNKQAVNMQNVADRNNAQMLNLQNKQRVADQNVGLANQQQMHNKNLKQQQFDNEMKKRGGSAGVAQSNQQAAGQNSQNEANAWNNTVGTGLTAAAMFSDERLKTDVEEFDASKFLDDLTAYKFKYKNPKHGEGEQVGVMAQDVEKEAPGLVEDTPQGKMVDYGKSQSAVLAALADLNDRVRKIGG